MRWGIPFAKIEGAPYLSLQKPHLEEVNGNTFLHDWVMPGEQSIRADESVVAQFKEVHIDIVNRHAESAWPAQAVREPIFHRRDDPEKPPSHVNFESIRPCT